MSLEEKKSRVGRETPRILRRSSLRKKKRKDITKKSRSLLFLRKRD